MPSLPRNLLLVLIIFMTLGMLFVGLYPFNYFPKNRVSVSEDGNGLQFFGRGIAYSTQVGDWPNDNNKGAHLTLELELKPERTYTHGIPRILSLCDDTGREVMYVGQWKNSLIIRLMEDNRWIEKIKKEIGAGDVLNPGDPVLITLTFNERNADIYANGRLVEASAGFDLTEATSSRAIRSIVLGNSSTGDSPWQGEISRFSAFGAALNSAEIQDRYEQRGSNKTSYSGEEFINYWFDDPENRIIRNKAGNSWDLLIPEILTPLRKEFLAMPSGKFLKKISFYQDPFINVVGFMPLGLALTMFFSGIPFKKNSILNLTFPVLIGGLLSLFIETNQVFLISRSSSMTDLILNILGSGLGVGVFWKTISVSRFQTPKMDQEL